MVDSPLPARRLTALDRAILAVNGALRSMGAVGFETQMHVELAGRLSGQALQDAFARLAARYPIIAARLRQDHAPAWEMSAQGRVDVVEADLASDEPEAVHAFASQRMAQSHDLATQAPLQVHLLHRPGAGDVLLLQYSHLLMDNMAAGMLVRELDQAISAADWSNRPVYEPRGLVRAYLRGFPHARRRQAGRHIVQFLWQQFRMGAVLLNPGAPPGEGTPNLQMLSATMDSDAVLALRARLVRSFGYPCMSMAILASTFRLMDQHALPTSSKKRRFFGAGIGIDLGLRGPSGPIFQNLMTMIPMFAGRETMRDRDELTRLLSQQLRDALRDGLDLGFLRFSLYPGMHSHTARWLLELFFRYGFSLWFAHFGNNDFGATLGGVPIDAIRFVGPCWSPLGFTLLTNQHAGRIHFQVTHIPEVVPAATAEQILHGIITDLQA